MAIIAIEPEPASSFAVRAVAGDTRMSAVTGAVPHGRRRELLTTLVGLAAGGCSDDRSFRHDADGRFEQLFEALPIPDEIWLTENLRYFRDVGYVSVVRNNTAYPAGPDNGHGQVRMDDLVSRDLDRTILSVVRREFDQVLRQAHFQFPGARFPVRRSDVTPTGLTPAAPDEELSRDLNIRIAVGVFDQVKAGERLNYPRNVELRSHASIHRYYHRNYEVRFFEHAMLRSVERPHECDGTVLAMINAMARQISRRLFAMIASRA